MLQSLRRDVHRLAHHYTAIQCEHVYSHCHHCLTTCTHQLQFQTSSHDSDSFAHHYLFSNANSKILKMFISNLKNIQSYHHIHPTISKIITTNVTTSTSTSTTIYIYREKMRVSHPSLEQLQSRTWSRQPLVPKEWIKSSKKYPRATNPYQSLTMEPRFFAQ